MDELQANERLYLKKQATWHLRIASKIDFRPPHMYVHPHTLHTHEHKHTRLHTINRKEGSKAHSSHGRTKTTEFHLCGGLGYLSSERQKAVCGWEGWEMGAFQLGADWWGWLSTSVSALNATKCV